MNEAEKACHHILQRCVTDRCFSWLMWGTESMRLCVKAEAKRQGVTRKDVQKQLSDASKAYDEQMHRRGEPDRTEPEVKRLREQIDELKQEIKELEQSSLDPDSTDVLLRRMAPSTESLHRVKELLRQSELGFTELTVDRLRDAIDGNFIHF